MLLILLDSNRSGTKPGAPQTAVEEKSESHHPVRSFGRTHDAPALGEIRALGLNLGCNDVGEESLEVLCSLRLNGLQYDVQLIAHGDSQMR